MYQPILPPRSTIRLSIIFLLAILGPIPSDSFGQSSGNVDQAPTTLQPAKLQEYETKYYHVYTDVDPDEVKEACIRMTKMAEEYHNRTSDFAGQIRSKLPFYLFKNSEEYYAAGGLKNSAGVFNGTRLMAIGDKRYGRQIWHIVQHEGFHQFAHAVIGGQIPIWVNEGMAEYFGEGIFTGDGYVTGVIPVGRLQRIRKTMELPVTGGGFISLAAMMNMSHATWNQELSLKNYDQAWSMVQFLAHGDNGAYQRFFSRYMGMISNGVRPEQAWAENFGDNTEAFQARWRAWWESLPANPTADLYSRAAVATLTSFLARAFDQKQTFANFEEFEKTAEDGSLKSATDEWLPPSILQSTLRDLAVRLENGEKFTLTAPVGMHLPELSCTTAERLHLKGTFTLYDGHVEKVMVTPINAATPKRD